MKIKDFLHKNDMAGLQKFEDDPKNIGLYIGNADKFASPAESVRIS